MKRLIPLLLVLMLLTSCAVAEDPAVTAVPEATAAVTPMPTTPPNAAGMPYVLDDYPYAPVQFSEWKGTPTYLNFFTTWCTYCRQEMQDLKELQAEYGDSLRVILVHVPSGEDEATARAYLEKEGLADMNFVADNGFISYLYGVNGFPTSVIIDEEGYLFAYYSGLISADTMRQAVEAVGAVPVEDADAL